MTFRPHKTSAFMLVELLVVIGIIGLLVAVLLPAFSAIRDTARAANTTAIFTSISSGLESYRNELDAPYPPSSSFPDDVSLLNRVTNPYDAVCVPNMTATGANLFHDIYESLGHHHFLGSPEVDDEELFEHNLDRIYDTYADEREFEKLDEWIGRWAVESLEKRPYTTRAFIYQLGLEIDRRSGGEVPGIVTTAARHNFPIYCPAIGDSSIGLGLATAAETFIFDVVQDVRETGKLVVGKDTMVLYCGGGTPKNFIQQTEVTVKLINRETSGHKWAVQFVTDSPQWGGLSGCSFSEAVSWGKIDPHGEQVTVHCDTTIALPIVASAVMSRVPKPRRR